MRNKVNYFSIATAIALWNLVVHASSSEVEMTQKESSRVLASLVRITIIPRDSIGNEISEGVQFGYGARITHTGIILTAAHVCFPYKNQLGAADSLELTIESWNDDTRKWVRDSAQDLSELEILTDSTILEKKSKLRCLSCTSSEMINRELDFAFIKPKGGSEIPRPFLDVIGLEFPWCKRTVENTKLELYCTSDVLHRKEAEVSHTHVAIRETKVKYSYALRSYDRTPFVHGNSGSPLIAYYPGDPNYAFLAGFVVRGFNEPTAAQNFDVLTVPELIAKVDMSQLFANVGTSTNLLCTWPESGMPLLYTYFFANKTLDSTATSNVAACLRYIPTWSECGTWLKLKSLVPHLHYSAFRALWQSSMQYRDELDKIVSSPTFSSSHNIFPFVQLTSTLSDDDEKRLKSLNGTIKLQQQREMEMRKMVNAYIDKELKLTKGDPRRREALDALNAMLEPRPALPVLVKEAIAHVNSN